MGVGIDQLEVAGAGEGDEDAVIARSAGGGVVALAELVGHVLIGVAVEQHLRNAQRQQLDRGGQRVGFGCLPRVAAQQLSSQPHC